MHRLHTLGGEHLVDQAAVDLVPWWVEGQKRVTGQGRATHDGFHIRRLIYAGQQVIEIIGEGFRVFYDGTQIRVLGDNIGIGTLRFSFGHGLDT